MPTIKKLTWEEVPGEIKQEIAEANTKDILERYDEEDHHNPEIQSVILMEHNIELIITKVE